MNHEDFPCGSVGKETTCNVGDLGLIPGLGRSLGEGKGCPLQYSDLENSMDCIVHGVAKSWTRLSDIHFTSLHESWGFLVAFSGESFPFNLLCSAPPEESLSMAAIALCINISFFFWLCHMAHRLLAPWPGVKSRPWNHQVLTAGEPGNSLKYIS